MIMTDVDALHVLDVPQAVEVHNAQALHQRFGVQTQRVEGPRSLARGCLQRRDQGQQSLQRTLAVPEHDACQ